MVTNNRVVLRTQLKSIYESLNNKEKNEWAINANYTDYKGLYKYINYNQGSRKDAYPRVVNALIKVIGQYRFNNLLESVSNLKSKKEEDINIEYKELVGIANIAKLKVKCIQEIFNCDDIEILEESKQNLEIVLRAFNAQIDKLKIEAEI